MEQLSPEQFLEFLIQFRHPEKIFADMPGISEATCAALLGLDVERYRRMKEKFKDHARSAAHDLLQDSTFATRVDRLPFAPGQTIVGLGDSITDDAQSWLEILRYLLDFRRGKDGIKVINAGISADTTCHIISRFASIVMQQPDWIICMAGTNDVRLHGQSPNKILVSIEETEKNLKMLRNFATAQTTARWIWMTPATVDEERIAAFWSSLPYQLMWRNKDLMAVAESIRKQGEPVVDLQAVFGFPPRPEFLLIDGLHPSLAGQKAIAKALVENLSS